MPHMHTRTFPQDSGGNALDLTSGTTRHEYVENTGDTSMGTRHRNRGHNSTGTSRQENYLTARSRPEIGGDNSTARSRLEVGGDNSTVRSRQELGENVQADKDGMALPCPQIRRCLPTCVLPPTRVFPPIRTCPPAHTCAVDPLTSEVTPCQTPL